MTLIHVLHGPEIRGAENFALQLAMELDAAGLEQRILILQRPKVALRDEALSTNLINIICCLPDGLGMVDRWRFLRRVLGVDVNDVVLCHGQSALKWVIFALLFRRKRPKVIVKLIGFLEPWIKTLKRARLTLNRFLFRRASMCIALGPGQAAELRRIAGVQEEKIICIPNGRYAPVTDAVLGRSDTAIVMVGALSDEKNVLLALEVFKRVRAKHQCATMKFVGNGPLLPVLVKKVELEFDDDVVTFTGRVTNIWPYLGEATVLLLCSLTEGVPGVVIEASLAGLPVVAWDVGDVSVVLRNEVNGLLTPYGDEEKLAEAISSLLDNRDLRVRMSKSGREFAQSFRMESVAERYFEILSALRCQDL